MGLVIKTAPAALCQLDRIQRPTPTLTPLLCIPGRHETPPVELLVG